MLFNGSEPPALVPSISTIVVHGLRVPVVIVTIIITGSLRGKVGVDVDVNIYIALTCHFCLWIKSTSSSLLRTFCVIEPFGWPFLLSSRVITGGRARFLLKRFLFLNLWYLPVSKSWVLLNKADVYFVPKIIRIFKLFDIRP